MRSSTRSECDPEISFKGVAMNKELIDKQYYSILEILNRNSTIFNSKEYTYRLNKLEKVYLKMLSKNSFIDEFYSFAHEIRAIDFFSKFNEIHIANDSNNEAGADIVFAHKYNIECVTCTTGDQKNTKILKKSGYQVYNKIIDYNEKFRQMSLRFTSVVESKKIKLDNYIKNGVIQNNEPFIIFINLGPLAEGWISNKFGPEVTKILVGRGFRRIIIDSKTTKQIGSTSFSFIPAIKNNNNSDINNNIFADKSYSRISSIIFTSANLNENYNFNNTVNFINPHAINKIRISDFNRLPYWNVNNKSEFVPRIKGRKFNIEIW